MKTISTFLILSTLVISKCNPVPSGKCIWTITHEASDTNPLEINFNSESKTHDSVNGICGHNWSFGDGTSQDIIDESELTTPTHTYANDGTYIISLSIGCIAHDCSPKTDYTTISIGEEPDCSNSNINADFQIQFQNHNVLDLKFTTQNIIGMNYRLKYGDNNIEYGVYQSNMEFNHSYAKEGTYTACLLITDGEGCHSETCKEFTIESDCRFENLMDNNDEVKLGKVLNSNIDNLILINKSYSGTAIQTLDIVSGQTINNISSSGLSGWLDQNDEIFINDISGDGNEDIVLINKDYAGGAIRIIDLSNWQIINQINHGTFGGWMDPNDRMLMANVNESEEADLILINSNYSGGAIRAIDLTTGGNINQINHDDYNGWFDNGDRAYMANVNEDDKKDLVLVNTDYQGYAIRVVDISSGSIINQIPHGTFGGWMDSTDRIFTYDVNNDMKDDLILVNTGYSGGAIRAIDLTTGGIINQINHGTFQGWMDPTDRIFMNDVDGNSSGDLILVNTDYNSGAIRVVDISNGSNIAQINHSSFGGWMDNNDVILIGNTSLEDNNEIVLINKNYQGGAIRSINIIDNIQINMINHCENKIITTP